MCLITDKEPKIATEDIVVYKFLNEDLTSPYQGYQYFLNKIYITQLQTTKKYEDICPFCDLDAKFLSKHFDNYSSEVEDGNLFCYEKGFHSISEETLNSSEFKKESITKHCFKCIIPKGATYVEDFVGFIVSDKIIIKEKYEQ